MNGIKKILIVAILAITNLSYADRFNNDSLRNYYFAGDFGFQAPFASSDMKYYYVINSIDNLDLPSNTPLRLSTILGDRVGQMKITNGTKIILKPELDAGGKTKEQKQAIYDTLPYVVIEGENDFITVYLYNNQIGKKLVFNILAFEDFMMKTPWYTKSSFDQGRYIPSSGWEFGFEFYTAEMDFSGSQPTLFSNLQGIHPFFIDLHYTGGSAKPAPWATIYDGDQNQVFMNLFKNLHPYYPAQFFTALGDNGFSFEKSKWNPNVFFDNNIVYIKDLSDDDVIHVEKVLTDAGITLSSN